MAARSRTLPDTKLIPRGTYIGTSGWMYKDWAAEFYPQGLKKGHLGFLAEVFNTVELNSSFYHLPSQNTFDKWRLETPADFLFAVKLSRFITHQKRLAGIEEPLQNFIANAAGLKKKLGVILVQLPPSFRADTGKLENLLRAMKLTGKENKISPLRIAFEPRHASWFEKANVDAARKLLRKYRAAFVFADSTRFISYAPVPENITAPYVYLRFHGPEAMFASEYKGRRLAPWAARIKKWRRLYPKLLIFAYFNNDVRGYAPWDALALREHLV